MRFDHGTKIVIAPKFRAVHSGGVTISDVLKLSGVDPNVYSMVGDAEIFIWESSPNGVFVVKTCQRISRGYAVNLQGYKGKCKTGWWVPTYIFDNHHEDWLEDLPLAAVS